MEFDLKNLSGLPPGAESGDDGRYRGNYFDLLYAGVDGSLEGNGGPTCYGYISMRQRIVESLFVIAAIGYEAVWSYRRLQYGPASFVATPFCPTKRRFMMTVLSVILGVEIGLKLCSRTLLYLLNPCHILTAMQIALLAMDNTTWYSCLLFRLMTYTLSGPILALMFPVLNTLKLPLEIEMYYVQHYFLLIVPIYLVSLSGSYTVENLWDPYFAIFSVSILILYHYVFLQIIAVKTMVNLNVMLCPAVSDPFKGKYWRFASIFHQHAFVPLTGKCFALLSGFLFTISAAGLPVPAIIKNEEELDYDKAEILHPIPSATPSTSTISINSNNQQQSSGINSDGNHQLKFRSSAATVNKHLGSSKNQLESKKMEESRQND